MADGVFLLGFMASGKTAVGKALARRLGREFIDTDALVEHEARRPVSAVISEDGEEAFRGLEAAAVRAASRRAARTGAVVAAGGGAVLRPANVRAMRRSGTVVFLDAPLAVLKRRVRAETGGKRARPLWAWADSLFSRRDPLYRQACHLTVDAATGTPAEVAARVAGLLGHCRPAPGSGVRTPVKVRQVTVRVPGRPYPVLVGKGLLETLPRALESVLGRMPRPRCILVVDSRLVTGPGRVLAAAFRRKGWEVLFKALPAGERAKSLRTVQDLYGFFLARGVERSTPVVAVGGGTVGDAAGFAAATYMRGIPLVHVPTTLLAQADSAVGGKTGVNLPLARNAVGSFHQPVLVAADVALLDTLPERDLFSGLAEVVKTALLFDRPFALRLLRRWDRLLARDPAELAYAVRRCAALKAAAVSADERDLSGKREVLNFGHTVAHALEAAAGFGRLRHGEAVALGMAAAVRLSRRRGWLKRPGDLALAEGLLARLRTPPWPAGLDWRRFAAAIRRDKKAAGGAVSFVLLKSVGRPVRVRGIRLDEVRSAAGEEAC